jgi:malonyl-ACP decarboxylase
LIVGGSNFQQRETTLTHDAYRGRLEFLKPSYGLSFLDSDLCAHCSAAFGIRGLAHTIGSASASGQVAAIQAISALQAGQVDICIAMGALMDLSYWECLSLQSLGAMGSARYANEPGLACRPFDSERDGFIYGEACGVIVLERGARPREGRKVYARVAGWGLGLDGNRFADPSAEGEAFVIAAALRNSGWRSKDVDYVNSHGTGSLRGDEAEVAALRVTGLADSYINATKSLTGHSLTAAGAVEIVATVLQLQESRLHPTRNLTNPIDAACNWVRAGTIDRSIRRAVSLAMGFGGVNSALCLEKT